MGGTPHHPSIPLLTASSAHTRPGCWVLAPFLAGAARVGPLPHGSPVDRIGGQAPSLRTAWSLWERLLWILKYCQVSERGTKRGDPPVTMCRRGQPGSHPDHGRVSPSPLPIPAWPTGTAASTDTYFSRKSSRMDRTSSNSLEAWQVTLTSDACHMAPSQILVEE